MKKVILYLFSVLFFLQSCGTHKNVVEASGEVKNQKLATFYNAYQKTLPDFDALQIKSKIKTNVDGKSISANLKLYIENQKKIWLNASILGITGARALITPQGLQAYTVLDKSYIEGDFGYFNQLLKVDFIDYSRLQQLLLGQLFLIESLDSYDISTTNNQYVLTYTDNEKLAKSPVEGKYIHSFYLDSNYRLQKVEIEEPKDKIKITATYDHWQLLKNKNLPGSVHVSVVGEKTEDQVHLDYNHFSFEKTNPPFKIPGNYKKKEIK